jgi:hypothetical protein
VKSRVALVALSLAVYALFGPAANDWVRPAVSDEPRRDVGEARSALDESASDFGEMRPDRPLAIYAPAPAIAIASLPTMTPVRETVSPLAGYTAASLPAVEPPPRIAALPTVAPAPDVDRAGCDPAYPEPRTCIPPGPPFDQGCAITAERRFEVLPPDPQSLDHDADGIGCEPIVSGS